MKAMFPDDMTEQRKKLMATLAVVVNGLTQSRNRCFPPRARSPSVTSAMAPRPSTIPSSAAPCCGPWKRGSARPGRPRLAAAWTAAYGTLSGYMISEAYGSAQAAE